MSKRIIGAGGDDGPRQPQKAPTTLRTKTTGKVLFLYSAGETGGLFNQTDKLRSVLFDNTPIENSDGSRNFANVQVQERYGTLSQNYMAGYPSASNTIGIGTKVTTSTPVVHDTLVANIDAVRVTIRFPALFKQEENGDEVGNSVNFLIQRRLGNTGAWTTVYNITKNEKSTGPADLDYLVQRPPSTTGAWQVRVVRVTADNTSLTEANDIFFQSATNIQNVQLAYPQAAYVGLTVSAEDTGASFPRIALDVLGVKVRVPSNYNVATRVYTGVWNGTFSNTRQVCDNPAWFLYEALTNTKWGMGIADTDIDQYSFYDAAQYCDALVPDGKGGQEPRFTLNYQFMTEQQAWDFINDVAASFRAAVYTSGSKVKLVQDRPTGVSRLITNSNVIDGNFEYASSQGRQRTTAAVVYYNDPAQGWLSVPAYYEDTAAVTRYGYNKVEATAVGATTEGQAYRYAKWLVDTSVNNTETVTFSVGLSNAGLEPGEVIKLMDTTYAEVLQEAKLVSKTGSTITLDKPITVANGYTFDIVGSDGVTIISRTTTSTGTLSTMSFSGADFTALAGSDVVITGAVAPRQFKVTNVRQVELNEWLVSAVQYDPNKFNRVDGFFTLTTPTYQAPPSFTVVSPVTSFVFSEESFTNPEGLPKRNLSVRWTPPANQFVINYICFYRKDAGDAVPLGVVEQPFVRFPVEADGLYEVTVTAVNARGVRSLPATGSVDINLSAPPGAAALSPVSSLFIKGTTGSTFSTTDATITWADTNTVGASVLAGWEVRVLTTSDVLLRTEFVPVTAAKEFAYTYAMNRQDGGPRRSVKFSVRAKDTFNRYSTAAVLSATNPSPAAPVVTTDTGYDLFFAKVTEAGTPETDIAGCKIWVSTTNGFTPNDATNLVSNGPDRVYSQAGAAGATYYVRAALYDAFSSDTAGLNISAQYSVTPVTFAATDPNEYDIVDITLRGNDPSANRVSWTAGTIAKTSGDSGVGTTWAITAGSALWSSGTLYVYWTEGQTTLQATTTLATAIGATKRLIATYKGGTDLSTANGDFFVDGANIYAQTIGATQLVTGSAVITGTAQIADAIITGAKIQTATITNANIQDAAITNAKIANLDAGKINTGFLASARIAADSIVASQIDSRNLTIKDAAGTIIFSAGTPLTPSYITPASGWLNSNISVSGGAISGIGTGSGTVVANSAITVSGGAISGIGTGSGTVVANSAIGLTVNANGSITATGGPSTSGSVTPSGIGAINTDLTNAPVAVLNSSIGITVNANGSITATGGPSTSGSVTPSGIGAINTNLSNAPSSIINSNIGLSNSGGTITLTNAGTGSFVALTTANPLAAANIANFFTTGAVTGTYIADATIATAKIQLAAITNALIADAAISSAKIGDLQVVNAKIADAAIDTAKIGNLAVTTAKIGDLAVGTLKIADQAVITPVGVNIGASGVNESMGEVTIGQGVISLDAVGSGGGVAVIFSLNCLFTAGDATFGTANVRLYRNGVLLRSVQFGSSFGITEYRDNGRGVTTTTTKDGRPATITFFDNVGAGTYTYSATAQAVRNSGARSVTFNWSGGGMVLLGAKK